MFIILRSKLRKDMLVTFPRPWSQQIADLSLLIPKCKICSLPLCCSCPPPGSLLPGPTHLLFWQGKHLKKALCSEGMLSGISGQGSSAFLATEGCGDNRSPFVLSGAGWEQADVWRRLQAVMDIACHATISKRLFQLTSCLYFQNRECQMYLLQWKRVLKALGKTPSCMEYPWRPG